MDLLSQRWSGLVQDGTKVGTIGQLHLDMEVNVPVLSDDRKAMDVRERCFHILQRARGDEQLDAEGCQFSDDVKLDCGRGLIEGIKIVEGNHCVGELSQQTEELLFGWLRLLADMPSIGLVEKGKAARMSLEGLLDKDLQEEARCGLGMVAVSKVDVAHTNRKSGPSSVSFEGIDNDRPARTSVTEVTAR
jgi:hypothetical protein